MKILPKNKHEWLITLLWVTPVSVGWWFFSGLWFEALIRFLEEHGIPEAELISDSFFIWIPLVALGLVIFTHRYLFKKEIEHERERILNEVKSRSLVENLIPKSPKKARQRKTTLTKLDVWEEFLVSAKKCAEILFLNPSNKEYFELYETLDSGLKIMLGKEHADYTWFLRVSYSGYETHLNASRMFPKSYPGENIPVLQGLIKTILNCLRYFQGRKPPFTDVDFRDFPSKDVKRYVNVFGKNGRLLTKKNKTSYIETPGGILYRIENGRAVQQMNWELANKEGFDGSRDPKIKKMSLEELRKYLP